MTTGLPVGYEMVDDAATGVVVVIEATDEAF
jgi:hypothetical protein